MRYELQGTSYMPDATDREIFELAVSIEGPEAGRIAIEVKMQEIGLKRGFPREWMELISVVEVMTIRDYVRRHKLITDPGEAEHLDDELYSVVETNEGARLYYRAGYYVNAWMAGIE